LSIAALAPISPPHLKDVFLLHGYNVISEDDYNWVLAVGDRDAPIILGKLGDHVPLEILMDTVFTKASMDLHAYITLKEVVALGHPPATIN